MYIPPFIKDSLNFHAGCGNQRSGNKHDLLTLLFQHFIWDERMFFVHTKRDL